MKADRLAKLTQDWFRISRLLFLDDTIEHVSRRPKPSSPSEKVVGYVKCLISESHLNEAGLRIREAKLEQSARKVEQELKDHAEVLVLREMKEQAAQMVAVIHTIEQKENVGEKRKREKAHFDEVLERFEMSRKKLTGVEDGEEELEDTESDEETATGVRFVRIAVLES